MADLEILLSVLYGADVALHSDVAARVTDAADLLGVTVDLPFKTFSDDATQAQQQLQQQQQQPPPICCWHCNAAFRSLAELKIHIQSHQVLNFNHLYELNFQLSELCDRGNG